MQDTQKSYRQIFKSTSLFGGVQLFTILVSIVRSKVIALFIGSTGMGVIGLLLSTLNVIGEFTKLGLDTTAVREIAMSNNDAKKKNSNVSQVIFTIQKVVWFTGVFGAIVTILLSPFLSQLAFGNYDYTIAFMWISCSLLFNQLASGKLAVLQGFRKLSFLAKSNLISNSIGLLVSIPLYYFFRLEAIVLVIVLSSVINFIVSWLYSKKLKIIKVKLSNTEVFNKAKGMLKLGLMLSLHGSITLVAAYAFQIYLSYTAGVAEVGFYLAGFLIINSYIAVVFKAMRTDFFPRLSGIVNSIEGTNKIVNQQSIIGILIIGPLVVCFLVFLPIIIKILYSDEFLVISYFISWAILGVLFKTLSWSIGYVILAKGDNKLFIKTGLLFNSLQLLMNVIGYHFYGLEGLGISFLFYYICHFFCLKFITNKVYGIKLSKELFAIFIVILILASITFFVYTFENGALKYILFGVLLMITLFYSYYHLHKRINFSTLGSKYLKRDNE